ncbi:hypothetical protein KY359_04825 [Candidatus Woesearchaeota archaeon]|nr:hypothetical protein [Candidatus Woesearchaeota archaeon]
MREFVKRLEIGVEELILAFLIIIEAMDFLTVLPPALEYAEKTIAIIAMCYLFYKASITKITFGKREKTYDLMIVIAYFLLSLKTVVGFVMTAVHEESIVTGIYRLILHNAVLIEKMGFWLGGILLIAVAYFLLHEKVSKPCILSIIHEARKTETPWRKIIRFVMTYLILLSIFSVIFTLAIEWLAMTVDAPILMIILFFYLFVIVKRAKGIKTESFLKKVSESSEDFYARFISLFHSRNTITLAITGLLVLHLLVDIGHFIIPYTTGLLYPWYFEQLGPGHLPLSTMMVKDFAAASGALQQMGVMAAYIMNVLAVLMLFFGPAYIWSRMIKKKKGKKEKLPNIAWLFFGSLAVFITQPVFRMSRVKSASIVGVDITTQQVPAMQNMLLALGVAVLVMAIFYILGRKNTNRTMKVAFFAVYIYFALYLYYFFTDIAGYYMDAVRLTAQSGDYFISFHMLLLFAITIIFYIGGYLMFLYESYIRQKI